MGDCNIVMLALGSLPGQICRKGWIVDADIFGCVENGIAQISGASFLHVGIAVCTRAALEQNVMGQISLLLKWL